MGLALGLVAGSKWRSRARVSPMLVLGCGWNGAEAIKGGRVSREGRNLLLISHHSITIRIVSIAT
jgi:hypothetical protein